MKHGVVTNLKLQMANWQEHFFLNDISRILLTFTLTSEGFYLPTPLTTLSFAIQYKPDCPSPKQKWKNKPITMQNTHSHAL